MGSYCELWCWSSEGPNAVLEASYQVDLHHQDFPELWKLGIYMDEAPEHWAENSEKYKSLAQPIIEALENGEDVATFPVLQADLDKINKVCRELHTEVKERVQFWQNKKGKKWSCLEEITVHRLVIMKH